MSNCMKCTHKYVCKHRDDIEDILMKITIVAKDFKQRKSPSFPFDSNNLQELNIFINDLIVSSCIHFIAIDKED